MIINKFIHDTRGNFAIMTAVAAGALLMSVGAAVDTTGAYKAKRDLQSKLDISLLAAATSNPNFNESSSDTRAYYTAQTHNFLIGNGYPQTSSEPDVKIRGNFLTAEVTGQYDTVFGGVFGIDTMEIIVDSEVTLNGAQNLQIALVLDNTNSMNPNGKMNALREGARVLVDAVEAGGSDSKIALVPFSKYVRVSTDFEGSPWLSVPESYDTNRTWQQATHTGGTCTVEDRPYNVDGVIEIRPTTICTGQTTTYETKSKIVTSEWEGCVGVRNQPLDTVDGSFTTQVPGLLNTIPHEVTGLNHDIEAWCPYEIVPLTNDYPKLRNDIAQLYGTNKTYLPIGLTWGQRVLSPAAPYDEADEDGQTSNIMVIMSDGMNTAEYRDTAETQADYEAPPYIYDADDDEPVPLANALTERLCTEIKESGTEIYTIAFQIADPTMQLRLRNCASSPSKSYFAGDNVTLVSTFRQIAESLESEVRISR